MTNDHMTKTKRTVDLAVPGTDAPMRCHLVEPDSPGPHGAVIVAHELFGVNDDIAGALEDLAALGHVAIAPELYHRTAAAGAVFPRDDEGRAVGFEHLGHVTRATAIPDVDAVLAHLASRGDIIDRVALLGFSFGGHVAYAAATQLDVALTIVLYGGWITTTDIPLSRPEATVELTPGIRGRLAYLVGADDALVDAEQVATIDGALARAGIDHEVIVYPGAEHAFFWEGTAAFDRTARDAAWVRIVELLAAEISGRG
jgi:carboxymethylenebutenolidase